MKNRLCVSVVRGGSVVSVAALLAACSSGSGGSTGGGPGLTLADFPAALSAAQGEVPTSDMRSSGTATYDGAVQMNIIDAIGSPVGAAIGDLALSVNFDQNVDAGQDPSVFNAAVTGTISNITGETTAGDALVWDGDLTTQNGLTPSVASIVSTTITAPIVGDITTRTGTLSANFGGDASVSSPDLTYDGDAYVFLSGTFTGSGGTGIWGTASALLVPDGSPSANAGLADYTGSGSFIAD